MNKKFIVANWKMHPSSRKAAEQLFGAIQKGLSRLKHTTVVIAPPFVYLESLSKKRLAPKTHLAGQDVFWESTGAYTGEISPDMLKQFGVSHVILGHSERRAHLNETNKIVNKKIKASIKAGFTVVLCVGEKERGTKGSFPPIVKEELVEGLRGVSKKHLDKLIVAYEPIWAIGRGKTADTPEDFFAMIVYIRRVLLDVVGKSWAHRIPVIYGGSVNSRNAKAFFQVEGASGVLIGRASLDAKELMKIARQT